MSYLHFIDVDCAGLKTVRLGVVNQSTGVPLGEIKWFGRWRRYAFFPMAGCVFDATCLAEITAKLKELMDARR